ncbi:MAG TPA: lysophospholipase, partial [Kofleriaceae bacterium]|nr:lysophospholipase [Kofleriaceae bacterium]
PSTSFSLTSRDGTELHAELYETPQARGAALVLHGYAEHCGRYREVAHVLRQAGLSALALDVRGHGRAAGPRGHAMRFEDFLDDVDAALAAMDARLGGEMPLALVCHSHGSLIGLRLMADPYRRPRRLRCAVLSSPFLAVRLKVSPFKRLAARALGRVLPTFSLPNGIPIERLTHDEERLAARRVDTLCHDVAGARWFVEATAAQEWVREYAPRIDLPTLWVVAGDDHIADPAATRAVFERAGGDKRWHLMEGMYHEVFNETDRGSVFSLMRAFLSENFPD